MRGVGVQVVRLQVEVMSYGTGQSGNQINRAEKEVLSELRTGIPEPLRSPYDRLTQNATHLPSYDEPFELGKHEGCRLAVLNPGFWMCMLFITPAKGKWTLQEAIKAEERLGTIKALPPETCRVVCFMKGPLKEKAVEIQHENWRKGLPWYEGLDALK